jgi:hypothetical protein
MLGKLRCCCWRAGQLVKAIPPPRDLAVSGLTTGSGWQVFPSPHNISSWRVEGFIRVC